MTIDGKVHIAPSPSQGNLSADSQSSLKGLIVSSLQSSGIEISADFHSKTKMDDIQVDSIFFSGKLGYQPVQSENPSETPQVGTDPKNIGKHFEEFGKKFLKENMQQMNKEMPVSK